MGDIFTRSRCVSISKQGHQINEEIRDKEVRLVSADGEQLGIMTAQEALSKAEEANLDLVKIRKRQKKDGAKNRRRNRTQQRR